jgi:NAD(P)-dependent dehydrogenase (short-subunit alcohol dehydrogenase family)
MAREDILGPMTTSAFEGKVALITGGASGIGAALAKALGARGADVVIADRQVRLGEDVAARIRDTGGRATARELDVRDVAAYRALVEETVARAGRIDLFFNNAGIGVAGEMDTYAARDWDDVFDVNLRGVAYGIHCVYPVMIRQRAGHIVNTASMAGLVPAPGAGSYVGAKHAVVGISRALRVEARRHGVRVSALCPGAIATPILTGGKYGRSDLGLSHDEMLAMWARARPMDPDVFAKKVLREVERNTEIIIVPSWWKAFWYLERLAPSVSTVLWEQVLRDMRARIERAQQSKRTHPPVVRDEAPAKRA